MHRYEHGGDVYGSTSIRLDFSVNTNPMGMPPGVVAAITEHIRDYERYPDPFCRELTAAIAQKHFVEPSMVLCGNGAADLIFRICAFYRPKRMLTLAPTFSEYRRSVEVFGGEVLEHPLLEEEGFALTPLILDDITGDIDLLILCNPNNPTGQLAPPDLLRGIMEACKQKGVLLLLDECFLEFTGASSMVGLLREYPNLLILKAFTKLYAMAGLRLGYLLCADTALLSRIAGFGPTWSVSVVAQMAGAAALKEQDWGQAARALAQTERDFMRAALTALGLTVYPSDANYILVKSPLPLYDPLLARGILVRRCENFAGLDDSYIRIGLKTREQNMELLHALSEVIYG